jgi:membrane protease YdiL (CAAX protease family)
VYWTAIVVLALLFAYDHVNSSSARPGATAGVLMFIMASNTFFGCVLGWLYWRLGLEAAILTHFLIDAFGSAVAVPAYFSGNTLIQATVLGSMIVGCGWSLRILSAGRDA